MRRTANISEILHSSEKLFSHIFLLSQPSFDKPPSSYLRLPSEDLDPIGCSLGDLDSVGCPLEDMDSSVGCLETLTCKPVTIPCLVQTLMLP